MIFVKFCYDWAWFILSNIEYNSFWWTLSIIHFAWDLEELGSDCNLSFLETEIVQKIVKRVINGGFVGKR